MQGRTLKGIEVTTTSAQTGYAPVNGLNMYYEIHSSGQPLVLLPGTTHIGVMEQTALLLAIVPPFLDAPMGEVKSLARKQNDGTQQRQSGGKRPSSRAS